jgi:hypothetical protein
MKSWIALFSGLLVALVSNNGIAQTQSDLCFETAERLAIFALQETEGYGFVPLPTIVSPATTSNPDGVYTFSFGTNSGGKDSSLPTYELKFHLNSKSQSCSLTGWTVK